MIVRVNIDAQETVDVLEAVDAVLDSGNLSDAAGAFAANRIVNRTLLGKDMYGSPFAPYSDSYRKSGNVNLYDTGEMLGSIEYSASGDSATITCSSGKASYHQQGQGNNPVRKFMGLSETDVNDMVKEIVFDVINSLVG